MSEGAASGDDGVEGGTRGHAHVAGADEGMDQLRLMAYLGGDVRRPYRF
jgi:hypothetical protein